MTGVCFTLVTVTACVLVGQHLTHSSWPLAHTRMLLVGLAAVCYFASFVLRARGWHRLFPPEQLVPNSPKVTVRKVLAYETKAPALV